MVTAEPALLERARECYAAKAWADARALFLQADQAAPLGTDDLWALGSASALSGEESDFFAALERVYRTELEAGGLAHAVRAAFWLGFRASTIGEASRANGWLVRAERLVERVGADSAEHGYSLLGEARRHFAAGELAAAERVAREAEELGERFDDRQLSAFARNLQARASFRQGELTRGFALFDEMMLTVASGEVMPILSGLIYCSAIDCCQSVYAIDRAREWTQALGRWCDEQPQLLTFTGACLTSRAEVMQLAGQWPEALREVAEAERRFSRSIDHRAVGEAHFRRAEIQRARGELAAAEESYRLASQAGRDPQPGLALLRLAQGKPELALAAIRRAATEASSAVQRAKLWPALIEALLAQGEVSEARAASNELALVVDAFQSELLRAHADHARGNVELAEEQPGMAAVSLKAAFSGYQRVAAPYLAAKARLALACACHALGDADGAALEAAAARAAFRELGASLDVEAVDVLVRASRSEPSTFGLTPRELEVLRLVAAGKTNKLIARELCLSEKTVDRHLSNILSKLDVPSRAAATAYAFQHKLL